MAIDPARTAKGALAGAVAAGVWAAQQPLDKRVFGSDYDDVEMVGKAVTRGPAWYPVGLAIHLQNGAVFGAVYSIVAPRVPLPGIARGALAALVENFALWPLGRVTDRFHPARAELPGLAGNHRALWQATWRHFLFGALLGELEHRLNGSIDELAPGFESVVSPNGHGRLEDAVPTAASRGGAGPSGA